MNKATQNLVPKSVIIIGGGMGGLVLCQALRNSHIRATVYERDVTPYSREQGYYIGINPDGASALSKLDHPELKALLQEQKVSGFNVVDNTLRLLAEMNFGDETKDSVKPGLVNRLQLRETLTHGIEDKIVWNKRFARYEELPDRVVVYFEDGTQAEADLLVGADGASSRVRSQRCPDLKTEPINISCFAAMIKNPDEPQIPNLIQLTSNNMLRVMGPNGHTVLMGSIVRNNDKYLFWALSHPKEGDIFQQDENSQRKVYEEKSKMFHQEVQNVVKMPSELLMLRELHAVKPLSYNPLFPSSRVTLLGDAAHAMTTHRGLGANTALQDASDLAFAIKNGRGLSEYEEVLFKRGFSAVRASRQSTDSMHASGMTAWFVWVLFYMIGTFFWLKKKLAYSKKQE